MKKVLSIMVCLTMLLVGGLTLSACGQTEPVSLTKGPVSFSAQGEKYENNNSLTIMKGENDNEYKVGGTASFMNANQASEWGTTEGAAYVVLTFKYSEGAKIVYHMTDETTKTTTDKDDFSIIWVVKNTNSKLVADVTEKDAEAATTYTVTFKDLKITQTQA